jgi:hypothetical protein
MMRLELESINNEVKSLCHREDIRKKLRKLKEKLMTCENV